MTERPQVWAIREQQAAPEPKPIATQNAFCNLPVTRCDPDGRDEESDMIQALNQLAGGKLRVGKKPPQKSKHKPLSRERISKIAQDINDGKLKLPDVDLQCDEDWVALWALVDSGSSVHVVNVEKVFPGARIKRAHPNARPFNVANSGAGANLGPAEVKARTNDGGCINK